MIEHLENLANAGQEDVKQAGISLSKKQKNEIKKKIDE